MKNKYHILNESPKVSDRELEGFMDFDALMDNNASPSGSNKNDSRKYWLLGLLLAGLLGAGTWLWSSEKPKLPITAETISEQLSNTINETKTPQEITSPTKLATSTNDLETTSETQTTNLIPIEKSQSETKVTTPTNPTQITTVSKVENTPPKPIAKPIITTDKKGQGPQPKTISKKTSSPVKETRSTLEKEEYVFIDAQPKGGTEALYDYVNTTLVYPKEVADKKLEGEVLVSFVIAKDGRPKNIKVERSLGAYFDQEALRVIEGMPDWIPASLNGVQMESKLSIPLFFNLKVKN